jgi:phospholipid transport system transporter-binding protein
MSEGLFKPTKPITFATADAYYRQLLVLFRRTKGSSLLICLSEVSHCDSAGLALLIEAKRMAKKYNKQLVIEGMAGAVRDLAVFCGVEEILLGEIVLRDV